MKKTIWIVGCLLFVGALAWFLVDFIYQVRPQRIQLQQEGFIANYFVKGQAVDRKAVIILGGGQVGDYWGAEFAKAGHVGLSLPYHRLEGLPRLIEEIPLEYFEKAIDWLGKQVEVDAQKIFLKGSSMNAELALVLAATFPEKIAGVIAYCPSAVHWSNTVYPWSSDDLKPKWIHEGKAVPFLAMEKIVGGDSALIETLPYWNKGLDDSLKVSIGMIQVEKIRGPILLLSPTDDKVWPSLRMGNMIVERLTTYDFPYPIKHIRYEGAGHLITAQYRKSFFAEKGNMQIGDKVYEFKYGGTPEGNLSAQIDSRKQVMAFVEQM